MAAKKSTKKQPTIKEVKKKGGKPLGVSGSNVFSGIIVEEYNPDLVGQKGIATFDVMRKQDGTVGAVVLATQLPIRRAKWFITPASDDEKDIEIANFIERALFEEMKLTWDSFLRQALLLLPFGVMVFEKVFEVKNVDGVDMVTWLNFAPRMPSSITHWETNDGKEGIQQLSPSGGTITSVPMDKLIVFVNNMEGDNFWGISQLRSAYKHYDIKYKLEKIDAIAHERQSLGIPFVKLPINATEADITKAKTVLKNMRANEEGYLLEPEDMEVEFKDMKANTTKDASKAIAYHNRQIAVSALAQFIDLGSGASGSRALSEDQTDLFLQSLEATANNIKDVLNKNPIKQLVDLNYEGVEKYPKIDYSGISRVDVEKLSTAYQRLTQSGALSATEADEQYIRGILNLPMLTDEDREKKEENKEIEKKKINEKAEELGMAELLADKNVTEKEVEEAIQSKLMGMSTADKIDFTAEKRDEMIDMPKKFSIFKMAEEVLTNEYNKLTWQRFQENNDFKSWRKLTFAEKKVNFQRIQEEMDKLEGMLTKGSIAQLTKEKDVYLAKMAVAMRKKDTVLMKQLQVQFTKKYTALLNDVMKKSYTFAKNNAAREMGVKAPPSSKEALRAISISSDSIARKQAEQLTADSKRVLVDRIAKGESVSKTIGAMDATMAKAIEKVTRDTSALAISGNINIGRRTVFEKNADKIYALQRSEILDKRTCNFCLSMDSRIIEKDDRLAKTGPFHSNCRGIWVEILQDEENKPTISGVPNSIRDKVGEEANELIQPKNPIVKKNSPAAKKIDKGKAGNV